MRIVVNHLTRMTPGFICVAGISVESNEHIRPICNRARLPLRWEATQGGVFGIGNVVDLGPVKYRGAPPEVEDREFREQRLRCLDRLPADAFWALLDEHHDTRLQRIFGPQLRLAGNSCTTDRGTGKASLGVIVPDGITRLYAGKQGGVRLAFTVGRASLDLSVSDLRFYRMDDETASWAIDRNRLASVAYALETGVPAILSVGLTRPFRRDRDDNSRHWLQVNNIHLADDPLGDLEYEQ
ncbi:MAG: dual OB domain-containing protein [Vicinamibacterales bacterium]